MYQPQSQEKQLFTITIEPIHHYASIQKIQQLLNNINQVQKSNVKKIKDHQVKLEITWQGSEEQLESAIGSLPLPPGLSARFILLYATYHDKGDKITEPFVWYRITHHGPDQGHIQYVFASTLFAKTDTPR